MATGQGSNRSVIVASKPFGESYLLAEMFAQLLESRGFNVERRPGLGATEIAFAALRTGAIDVYPEYTGTGLIAILHDTLPDSVAADPRAVFAHVYRRFEDSYHTRWLPPLGFENTYAIAVLTLLSGRLDVQTMRQLNRRIEVDGEDVKVVAADELRAVGLVGGKTSMTRSANSAQQSSFWRYLWDRRATIFSLTMRHLL